MEMPGICSELHHFVGQSGLEYHILKSANDTDVANLQMLLESAQSYSWLVQGAPTCNTAALDLLLELPPDKTEADKFVFGIFSDGMLIGCVDVVRGFPFIEAAYIGLLLFSEPKQGRGYGKLAFEDIRLLVVSWHCHTIRLCAISTNQNAIAFWKRRGFVEIYRKTIEQYIGEAIVMEWRSFP